MMRVLVAMRANVERGGIAATLEAALLTGAIEPWVRGTARFAGCGWDKQHE
jgi:hypothetical protein